MSIRADIPPRKPASRWQDRIEFLRKMTIDAAAVHAAQNRAQPICSSDVIFGLPAFDEAGATEAFLRENYGVAEFVVINPASPYRPSLRRWGSSLRWRTAGLVFALLALLDFSDERYAYLGDALLAIQVYSRVLGSVHRVFFFHLYGQVQYLVATHIIRHSKAQVVAVPFGCLLWTRMRYTHIPVSLGLTSAIQAEEVLYLRRTEHFAPTDLRRVGPFSVYNPTPTLKPAGERSSGVDIGFVSSGDWARRCADDQAWSADEIEHVRTYGHADNYRAQLSASLLSRLIEYAESRRLAVRIYPHPYERRLLRDHGIEPPWFRYLVNECVSWDDSADRTSDSSIRDARVAVSVLSSLILARIDDGFCESFIQEFTEGEFEFLNRRALGRYSENVFADFEELEGKLDAIFEVRSE